jgi:gliding motility-associated-like protein
MRLLYKLKLYTLGRISLVFLIFNLSVLSLSAQSGYSNLEFVENRGQWDTAIKFQAEINAGTFFLRNGGYSVMLHDTSDMKRIYNLLHSGSATGTGTGKGAGVTVSSTTKDHTPGDGGGSGGTGHPDYMLHSHLYHVSFEHANPHPEIVPEKGLTSYNNYLVGDRKHWVSKARLYLGVTYKDVYNGIDVHYYTNEGVLKYDIIVHPGADPAQIVLKYVGADQLSIKKGQLLVKTSVSTVKELAPRTYQVDDKGRTEVSCSYVIRDGNKVSFKIKDYSPDALLVIDPTEIFCTFTGSRSDNWGYTATYDNAGNFYAGGIVVNSSKLGTDDFGATSGAFQQHFAGGDHSEGVFFDDQGNVTGGYDFDVAIMKFNNLGNKVMYATYLGGSGDEQPHSMICDAQGNLIITGRTSSTDFPAIPSQLLPASLKGFDLFVTKLNADGSFPIGSQRIGGGGDDGVNYSPKYVNDPKGGTQDLRLNYGDDGRGEVILDAANNIFIGTCTKSTDFPMVGAFQGTNGAGQQGVLIKLKPDASAILASSYLGGNGSDAIFSVAQSPINNDLYVSGGTMSTDLPGTAGALATSNHGGVDGFVSRIRDNGGSFSLLRTTYFGTSSTDMIYGVQVDKAGFPYVTGTTSGVITPVNSPFNAGGNQATGKQFITKLQPDLSAVVYSANFGPGGTFPNISPTAFLVDRCENVYVSGWGGGADKNDGYNNSGTVGLKATPDAIQTSTDGDDFYFFVLKKNAASQLYGSFFGQKGGAFGDHVDGGTSRFDKQGVIYQSICANCYGPAKIFPTTSNVVAGTNGTGTLGCNEAAVKISFNFTGIFAGLKLALDGRGDTLGCVPLTVTLTDTVRRAKSYIWHYGDGSPDLATTDNSVTHIYTAVGIYRVMLIGIDSSTCNVADTVYQNITVKDNRANLDFDYVKVGSCNDLNYVFHNLSTTPPPAQPFGPKSFTWVIDGTTIPDVAVTADQSHSFPAPGTYKVSLILTDTNYCNAPSDTTKLLYITSNVDAQISTPLIGCAPYYAHFDNNSIGGQTYLWDFGDGTTSTDRVPADHLYPDTGTYMIRLTVWDPATCNLVDNTEVTIHLLPKPIGDFTWTPDPPAPNTRTVFTPTNSDDVVKWEWLFGDGASTVKVSADTVQHQYQRTDTFQVCLVVFNQQGCTDTICHPVAALINPLLDVPNAFTPGRFGQNGVVKVVGFGIVRMNFKIYNRWGQMVFQSNSPNIGWDGMYKGALQPMDVYGYTLEAEFYDGTRASRKGDITLIR